MSYGINPSAWGVIFPVPSQIVDKHIRLAGAAQLKALLWVLRHANEPLDIEEMAKAIGQKTADAVDALQYWVETGILINDDKKTEQSKITENKNQQNQEEEKPSIIEKEKEPSRRPSPPELPVIKPSHSQILARAKESPDIAYLFNEAQVKLGRTIGYDGQCTLLMMHDQYGLPIEVILMILSYAASVGKISFSYIGKMGQNWFEKEIDTIEKAEEEINHLDNITRLWQEIARGTGISTPRPTAKQSEYIVDWVNRLKFDVEMIILAYEQMANNCHRLSFPYMDKVLKNWHSKGIKTPEDAEKEDRSRKKQQEKNQSSGKSASYDLDEFNNRSVHEPILYEKRNKK